MHGTITSYDSEEEIGTINGEDGQDYTMSTVDCQSIIPPKIDAHVNFEPHGDKATEIYVLSSQIAQTTHHLSSNEQTHHKTKKSPATLLPYVVTGSVLIFITVLIYGELDRRHIKEVQNSYEMQIKKIETLLATNNCDEAHSIYVQAQETRNKIFKMGLYYSLDSHAKQAHAIKIAECYALKNDFRQAIKLLDIHRIHDPDYLYRASIIYQNAGDTAKADEAISMASKYDTSMN